MNRRIAWMAGLAAATVVSAASAQSMLVSAPALSTHAAEKAAAAALAACQKKGFVVAVAIVDRAGVPLALLRDNLAGPHTPQTAIGKAWTAVSFRTDTSGLLDLTAPGKPSAGIRDLPGVVVLGGGRQIQAKGALVGAIGVSGAPGGNLDDDCGGAGIAAVKDALELE